MPFEHVRRLPISHVLFCLPVLSLCNSSGVPYPLIVIMHPPISLDFNQNTPFILLTDDLINFFKNING